MRILLPLALLTTLPASLPAADIPWNLAELRKPPRVEFGAKGPVQEVLYGSVPYQGKPTRVFGLLARPARAEGKEKAPAMLLVHGGGGTAFREWAELWAKRGYVALAIDLAGSKPGGQRLPDGGPGQGDDTKFGPSPDADRWTYHAIAACLGGVSLLGSLPEVDADRIGVTGISWGGYLTCILAGVDDRLKVAVPVYGCGFLHENSVWLPRFQKMTPEQRQEWVAKWDPSSHVGRAKMPVLFVNGTNDFAYPLDSYQKTYRLVTNHQLAVTVGLLHGHPQGWAPREIGLFVDQHLRGGVPLPEVKSFKANGRAVEVQFAAKTKVTKAQIHWTNDTGPWQKRKWQTAPLELGEGVARGKMPPGAAMAFFVTLTDDRGATVSTEHVPLSE